MEVGENIILACNDFFELRRGVNVDLLWSPIREHSFVVRRNMVFRLMHDVYGFSHKRLGHLLSRDRTSIMYSLKAHDPAYEEPEYAQEYEELKAYITGHIEIEKINPNDIMFIATISGNVGRNAEMRTINGKDVMTFSVAVESRRGKDAETTWVRVNYYNGGKLAQYVVKGAKVVVCGRLQVGVYNDKPDVTLWADNVEILKYADRDDEPAAATPAPVSGYAVPQEAPAAEDEGDDLPF